MLKMFLANLKMITRNKQALFWTLTFPLIFTFIFGLFFGKDSSSGGTIAVINHSPSELANNLEKSLAENTDLFKIQEVENIDTARDQVRLGKISAAVEIPPDFGDFSNPQAPTEVTLIYDPANSFSNQVILAFLNNYLIQTNFQIQNAKMIYGIKEEKTNSLKFNYFDFVLIGLLGMALMNSSIQGVAIAMSTYREEKILKRLVTTPLKSWIFIVSEVLSRLVVNITQISLILVIGIWLFKAHVNGSVFLIYLLSLLGAIVFQLIGFSIASFAKTTRAAEGMATAISIPMMFLAGVFFPLDQLPSWLANIMQYLPLAPLLKMMREVGLENLSLLHNPTNLLIILAWIIILLLISSYRFRLNEE